MDVVATFERVLDATNDVVEGVDPGQLGNPTPCSEWDVRAVINHIAGGAIMFTECVEQGAVPDARLGELMGGDNLGTDFKASYRAASDRARATFATPGVLEKMVTLPFGEMPAGVALNIAIMDVMTHAADIAKATGQTIGDEEIVTVALAVGHELITDAFRAPGVFEAERPAPADASATDRLLAFAGREI